VSRARAAAALFIALIALGLVFLHGHDPSRPGTYPPCPVHALTGLACPGCGTLRALHALMHGDLAAAWHHNPAAVLAVPLMLWALVALARFAATGRRPRARFVPSRLGPGLIAALALYMVARNVG